MVKTLEWHQYHNRNRNHQWRQMQSLHIKWKIPLKINYKIKERIAIIITRWRRRKKVNWQIAPSFYILPRFYFQNKKNWEEWIVDWYACVLQQACVFQAANHDINEMFLLSNELTLPYKIKKIRLKVQPDHE